MKRRTAIWMALVLACAPLPAVAIQQVQLDLGDIAGHGWRARHVRLTLGLRSATRLDVELSAAELDLPPPLGVRHQISVDCRDATLTRGVLNCPDGRAHLRLPGVQQAELRLQLRYDLQHHSARLRIPRLRLAGGSADIEGTLTSGNWRLAVHARHLRGAGLAALLSAWRLWPTGYTAAGTIDVDASAHGTGGRPAQAQFDIRGSKLGFSSPDASNAAQNITGHVQLRARRRSNHWLIATDATTARGIVCLASLNGACWQFPDTPLTLNLRGDWTPAAGTLNLTRVQVSQPEIMRAAGRAALRLGPKPQLQSADLQLYAPRLASLYKHYVQPTLLNTAFADLQLSGAANARFNYRRGGETGAQVDLHGVSLAYDQDRLAVDGLQGTVHWRDHGAPAPSQLRWRDGHLFKLGVGGGRLVFRARGRTVQLTEPGRIPVLDGALEVDRFRLDQLGTPQLAVTFDGLLAPVSMQRFSRAMGWPVMSGKLSGMIPALTYSDGQLTVGGVLLIRAFDGDITIRNLRLQRLFGVAPELYADVRLDNLDLAMLTRTFSFGSITGRLSGSVEHLNMVDWQPVAFDARFATPAGDHSRHRISQRAINNITSLGGGMSGALSRGFLQFFKEFSYSRLGINCRLHDGVCAMGGIAPAPHGYYLVKGGGLPRIDVIGYSRDVDWNTLVERLHAITAGTGAVVK